MSTHAGIYLPYGKIRLYKHFDGRPKHILPVLSHVVYKSSIFVRSGFNGAGTPLYKGSKADLLDEMGYLATRIITQFAVLDYRRRTSSGLKFEDEDIQSVVSPMAIMTNDNMNADYEYRIQKNGDISFFNVGEAGTPHILPYGTDMKDALHQLALIGADDDVEPVDPR
jgi:hypothetical protein